MTKLPQTSALLLALKDGWLTITFNTPENRNALSDTLAGELRETLEAVRDDRSVRGIFLRGNGGIFCAGGDLKAFSAGLQEGANHDAVAEMNKSGGALFAMINTMPQVVVALVEGAAIAGGLGMACCADIVAVTADAKFSLTETQLGIVPAQIAPYVIQRIGLMRARRLMLTGARFTGADAKAMGLADYVVAGADEFAGLEADIIASVRRCAPGANAATKEIALASQHLNASQMTDLAATKFADCLLSDEGREGVTAFVQKRKPSWDAT